MDVNTSELEQYLGVVIASVQRAMAANGAKVSGNIKFDLAVTNTEEGGGSLKVFVVAADGKYKAETMSRFSFEADPNHADRMAQMERAQARSSLKALSYKNRFN